MTSAAFGGLGTLERHRLVNEKLAPLFRGRIHALSMRLWAPGEAGAR
jgi:stress-induced morphogen